MNSIGRSFFWSFVASFGGVLVAFLVNLALVRSVATDEFGLIGILNVFIAFSHTTASGGFSQALIQRQDITQEDLDTCFSWNVLSALALYVALFFLAPWIANAYSLPTLSPVLRILALVIPIQSFYLVQGALVQKRYEMRKLAFITLGSSLAGGAIAIVMAWHGLGVWSLVANTLITTLFTSSAMWLFSKERMQLRMSKRALNKLLGFGMLMYLSTLLDSLYKTFQNSLVGKLFGANLAGFYFQAQKLYDVPISTMDVAISQVTYPLFSQMQCDREKIKRYLSLQVEFILWLIIPVFSLVGLLATPLVTLFYSPSWQDSAPILQLLLTGGGFLLLTRCHLNALKALGHPGLHTLVLALALPLSLGLAVLVATWGARNDIPRTFYYTILSFSAGMLLGYLASAIALWRKLRFALGKQLLGVLFSLIFAGALAAGVAYYNHNLLGLSGIWRPLLCDTLLFVVIYVPLLGVIRPSFYRQLGGMIVKTVQYATEAFTQGKRDAN